MPRGGSISARCASRSWFRDRSLAGCSGMTTGCGPVPAGRVSVAGSEISAPTVSSKTVPRTCPRGLAAVPMDAEHVADALELGEDARELLDARHLQGRVDRRG